MEKDGLICFQREEEKRKIYVITDLGNEVLEIEMQRIERLYQNMREELIMNDYHRVQFICIGTSSFGNVPSLTISNLPELRVISTKSESFMKTTSLTLSSIF